MENLSDSSGGVKNASVAIAVTTIALNVILSGSLALLWGLINFSQILAHFKLMAISLPSNVQNCFDTLYEFATFEVIPSDKVSEFLADEYGKEIDEDKADFASDMISYQTKDGGYEDADIFSNNIGTFLFFATVVLLLFFGAILWLFLRKYERVHRFTK